MHHKLVDKKGQVIDVEVSSIKFNYMGDKAVLSVIREITRRKEYERKINYLYNHDTLTGLPNRVFFNEKLTNAIANAGQKEKMALMVIDLDGFKTINDTLGHSIGDKILVDIASRFKDILNKDTIVARLGGDEFAIFKRNICSIEQMERCAQGILNLFDKPFSINKFNLYISASMGISLYPDNGKDIDTILKNADVAMYKAKDIGKNNYQFFDNDMIKDSLHQLRLINDMKKALERNEMLVYYQPKINIQSGKMIGLEALVRWQHPELGMISPGEFITLAEETGLILPLGEWVLRTACHQAKQWQLKGYPEFKVAVNLSAKQFNQRRLTEKIGEILEETGLDPGCLELEITESTFIHNIEHTTMILSQLKEMGIQIALDDFGTGYSSVGYLNRMAVDALKIDRSFIFDLDTNHHNRAISSAIIALAHSLNLKVTAEGVETYDQLAFLKEQNCDDMQGYLFSRPLAVMDFEKFINKYSN